MGYSGSHVSSVETMSRTATFEFAKNADEALGTPGTFRRLHARITKEAHPPWFAPFVHFEAMAARIHSWDNRFFTGLLQTEQYARAIIRAAKAGITDDVIDRDVAARMARQQVLDREEPPFCWFVHRRTSAARIVRRPRGDARPDGSPARAVPAPPPSG